MLEMVEEKHRFLLSDASVFPSLSEPCNTLYTNHPEVEAMQQQQTHSLHSYDADVVAWANEQAAFIRQGRFDLLDLEHIADEIEDVGKSEHRELRSRMAILIAHLIKWKYQPKSAFMALAGKTPSKNSANLLLIALKTPQVLRTLLPMSAGLKKPGQTQ